MRLHDMTELQLQVLACIAPHCPTEFMQSIIDFSAWVQPYHSYVYGNQNSIFTGASQISLEFTRFMSSCKHWYGIELVRHIQLDKLGKDELRLERRKVISLEEALNTPEVTRHNLPAYLPFDCVEHAIFNTEEDIILALKLSFDLSDYCFDGHLEYVAVLRTTLKMLELFRTRTPQKAIAFIDDGTQVRITPRAHPDTVFFCQLCWRRVKPNPANDKNVPPKYCRVHNQNRLKIASTYFNIHSGVISKYRTDLRRASAFAEALNEMQMHVVAGSLSISRNGTVLGQIMRIRFIAYFIAKNSGKVRVIK